MTDTISLTGPRTWIHAARVPTLPAATVPVLVGAALAAGDHHFRPVVFVATLLASLLIQIGTNFANDYFDFTKGADTGARLGPLRITSARIVSPSAVLRATIIAFLGAALIGIYLVVVGGWPILLLGLASIAAGIAYTAGPFPLGYHGLGDLFCFVFFGIFAVMGTYYLQTGSVTVTSLEASIPVGFLVTAILVVNNLRDMETDRIARKMTLAARFGRKAGRAEYGVLVLGSYAFPVVMAATGATTWWLFWLPLLTLPFALSLVRVVSGRVDGPSLNLALKGTGQLHLGFGFLFALTLLK